MVNFVIFKIRLAEILEITQNYLAKAFLPR